MSPLRLFSGWLALSLSVSATACGAPKLVTSTGTSTGAGGETGHAPMTDFNSNSAGSGGAPIGSGPPGPRVPNEKGPLPLPPQWGGTFVDPALPASVEQSFSGPESSQNGPRIVYPLDDSLHAV